MGAGISGLACTLELERLGAAVTVFEKRHRVGERFPNMEAFLSIIDRAFAGAAPPVDELEALRRRYGLRLRCEPIERIVIHSPHRRWEIRGRLGYLTRRGHDDESLEMQLARQVRSPVLFNRDEDWRDLARSHDHLVVATGDAIIPQSLDLWREDLAVWVRGANLRGRFETGTAHGWLLPRFTGRGYAYLLPYDSRAATLTLAVPAPGVGDKGAMNAAIDGLWQAFRLAARVDAEETLAFKLEGYDIGRTEPLQYGNVFFVGGAGGFRDPLLGFGQFQSIISGVMAARAAVTGRGLHGYAAAHRRVHARLLSLRRYMNLLHDRDYDRLLAAASIPFVRSLLARLPVDFVGATAGLARATGRVY